MARKRVGVLGGSFNPAHDGHRHISILALKRLELDEIWWLVAPQNPLKSVREMAPLQNRMASARIVGAHPRIRVTDIESKLGTRYTADTIAALKKTFPAVRFAWLMGADNLIQIPQWREWEKIFDLVPIAILTRPSYSISALSGQAATRFAACRIPESRADSLVGMQPPAWVFLNTPPHFSSASRIRARRTGNRLTEEPLSDH